MPCATLLALLGGDDDAGARAVLIESVRMRADVSSGFELALPGAASFLSLRLLRLLLPATVADTLGGEVSRVAQTVPALQCTGAQAYS